MTRALRRDATVLPALPTVDDIDGVIARLDDVIAWAIGNRSGIGYFAVFYKCAELPIRQAIRQAEFDDSAMLERFAVVFAQRYFDALNGYFHPDRYDAPSAPWAVTFDAAGRGRSTMIQQIVAGLNVHVCFDLALATSVVMGSGVSVTDYQLVNQVVARNIGRLADAVKRRSPAARVVRVELVDVGLAWFRRQAWGLACEVVRRPESAAECVARQAAVTVRLGEHCLQPPAWSPWAAVASAIGAFEQRDIAGNITALNEAVSR